jgi:MFS family permease
MSESNYIQAEKPKKKKSDSNNKLQRRIVLITSICFWSGMMAFFDFPQLFSEFLQEYYDANPVQIGSLFSAIYLPNIFLGYHGSLIVNKIGNGNSNLVCQLFALVGMLLCLFSVQTKNFTFLVIGRGFFGIGCEIGYLTQSVITDLWFYGSFLTVAYSLNRMMTYVVVSVSTYVLPEIFINKINQEQDSGASREIQLKLAFCKVLYMNIAIMAFVIVLSLVYKFVEYRRFSLNNRTLKSSEKVDLNQGENE